MRIQTASSSAELQTLGGPLGRGDVPRQGELKDLHRQTELVGGVVVGVVEKKITTVGTKESVTG